MRKIFTILLLTFSLSLWGQTDLSLVDDNTGEVILQMNFCLPIVEANDSMVMLTCSGINIIMPIEKINGELTIIIHPNNEDGPLEYKEEVNWYLAPKSYYKDSLGIDLK